MIIDEKPCYLFGRNKDLCDFHLEHTSSSRFHSVLIYHKHLKRSFLVDLKSSKYILKEENYGHNYFVVENNVCFERIRIRIFLVCVINGWVWLAQLVRSLPSNHKVPVQSPALPRFELICATFFLAKANSAFHPSRVAK